MATSRKAGKSEQTLAAIVKTALEIAVVEGLQGVSFGEVARRLEISKSGVFARVGSLDALQTLVIAEYGRIFSENVFEPALQAPRGLPRLDAIMELWIGRGTGSQSMSGGLHVAAAFELDHTESPLRERLLEHVMTWRRMLEHAVSLAVEVGHLRADTDPPQLAFELNSLMVGFLHDSRFVRDESAPQRAFAAYRRLVASYRADTALDAPAGVEPVQAHGA